MTDLVLWLLNSLQWVHVYSHIKWLWHFLKWVRKHCFHDWVYPHYLGVRNIPLPGSETWLWVACIKWEAKMGLKFRLITGTILLCWSWRVTKFSLLSQWWSIFILNVRALDSVCTQSVTMEKSLLSAAVPVFSHVGGGTGRGFWFL